ncbi:MAG: hypothetical protein Q4D98_11970 [Planctomycetia bacterium]|nr:hypothetical protein [Planctomycetia bacterium]
MLFSLATLGTLLTVLSLTVYRQEIREFVSPESRPKSPPTAVPVSEEEKKQAVEELLPNPQLPPREAAETVLEKVAEKAQNQSHEENLAELAQQGKQLKKFATEESVEKVAEQIHQWYGLEERASEPEFLPPEGPFDFDTAQIHDVARATDENGKYRYTAILCDAQGRSMRVELPPDQGKPLYQTMQMIQQNPLMETLYRSTVMPMLDKMLREKR